jgi:hypothetical protein
MSKKAFEAPGEVTSVDGEVVLLGPGAISGSMTPEAAEETGRRLKQSADQARRSSFSGDVGTPEVKA